MTMTLKSGFFWKRRVKITSWRRHKDAFWVVTLRRRPLSDIKLLLSFVLLVLVSLRLFSELSVLWAAGSAWPGSPAVLSEPAAEQKLLQLLSEETCWHRGRWRESSRSVHLSLCVLFPLGWTLFLLFSSSLWDQEPNRSPSTGKRNPARSLISFVPPVGFPFTYQWNESQLQSIDGSRPFVPSTRGRQSCGAAEGGVWIQLIKH